MEKQLPVAPFDTEFGRRCTSYCRFSNRRSKFLPDSVHHGSFCTTSSAIAPPSPQSHPALHRKCTARHRFRVAAEGGSGAQSRYDRIMKSATEVCPLCAGSGWKTVPGAAEHGVTRCDCQLRARAGSLIAAARIPKRHEECELSNFDFEGPRSHLGAARMAACRFVEEYPVQKTGLMLVGDVGSGKTHLAVGIVKALIREKGHRMHLLRLRGIVEADSGLLQSFGPSHRTQAYSSPFSTRKYLVLDDLGSVRPTEWRWDTVRLILNTRYNDNRTTIITTNFADEPARRFGSGCA